MQRVQAVIQDPRYREYLRRNRDREAGRKFCGHGFQHQLAVARVAYIMVLERKENLPREVVYAAGLLHDIGRWVEYDTGRDHGEAGGELAGEILGGAGFSSGEINMVARAIREHRGKGIGDFSSLGKILHLADRESRPCWKCEAREECYKALEMPACRGLNY